MGAPYALSSDLVSAWPAKSLEVAQYIDGDVPLLAMPQNTQTGVTYSLIAADVTKLVTLNNAGAVAVTLPLEASVPWATSTQLRLLNLGAGTVTVAGAVGVTINGTPLTLTQYKGANLIKTGTDVWTFIPFASGVGAADFSDAATGTYTGFKYIGYSTSGTLTVTTAGFADLLVMGAGGSSGQVGASQRGSAGGGGGFLLLTQVYLPAGTLTVKVGAAGAKGLQGNGSRLGDYYALGGGAGTGDYYGATLSGGQNGGSGGGGLLAGAQTAGGAGMDGQGFAGGTGASGASGGGGGGSAVGANGSANTGGAGGAGGSTTIFGTNPLASYSAGTFTGCGGGGGFGATTAGAGGTGGGADGKTTTKGDSAAVNTGGGGGGGFSSGAADGS